MRAVRARSIALGELKIAHLFWWLQAGSSFAYRLAHLTFPRSVTVCAVALVLYLG
jgi:hypothetical protein